VRARALAFVAIIAGGACGGLIGYSFVSLQCHHCRTAAGIAGVTGAVLAALGVGVIATITLRAMGEWRRIQSTEDTQTGHAQDGRGDQDG